MASTRTQPKVQPTALELELETVEGCVQVNLPSGVRLTIEGESLGRATIAAELRDWMQLFAAHAEAERRHEAAQAEWRGLALEARAFAHEVKAALSRYLDTGELGAPGREPPARRALAAARLSVTRELREAGAAKQKDALPGGSPPSLPWVD